MHARAFIQCSFSRHRWSPDQNGALMSLNRCWTTRRMIGGASAQCVFMDVARSMFDKRLFSFLIGDETKCIGGFRS